LWSCLNQWWGLELVPLNCVPPPLSTELNCTFGLHPLFC
jgi:hypothetical protein